MLKNYFIAYFLIYILIYFIKTKLLLYKRKIQVFNILKKLIHKTVLKIVAKMEKIVNFI